MTFNLTEKRLRALRLIQQSPGILASALTVICDTHPKPDGCEHNGFSRSRTGAQAATRWGMSYIKPLIGAGLVRTSNWHLDGGRVHVGGSRLTLTPLGESVARSGEMPGVQ